MNILQAFETLTKYFSENKDKLAPEVIEAYNVLRMKYMEVIGAMITMTDGLTK